MLLNSYLITTTTQKKTDKISNKICERCCRISVENISFFLFPILIKYNIFNCR